MCFICRRVVSPNLAHQSRPYSFLLSNNFRRCLQFYVNAVRKPNEDAVYEGIKLNVDGFVEWENNCDVRTGLKFYFPVEGVQ